MSMKEDVMGMEVGNGTGVRVWKMMVCMGVDGRMGM